MTCPDCTRAATTWNWHGYRNNCPDCEIRAFATGMPHQFETAYDKLVKTVGQKAADEIRQRVRDEYRRIKALKGPQC